MKEKIVNCIKERFDKTNCGITAVQISEICQVEYLELKPILNELHKDKKIHTRNGINNILIYLK